MKPLGVAVIGTGDVVRHWHVPAIGALDETYLAGIYSRTPLRSQFFARKHDCRAYCDLQEIADDPDVNLVIIASRDDLHLRQAQHLLAARKHVLVEKPLGLVRELVEAERISIRGGVCAVGYQQRFHQGHLRVRDMIRLGQLGPMKRIRIEWTYKDAPRPWRSSQDSEFSDFWVTSVLGTHCIDLAMWLLDGHSVEECRNLRIKTSNPTYGGGDEVAEISWTHIPSGCRVEIFASLNHRRDRLVLVEGHRSTVMCIGTLGARGEGAVMQDGRPLVFEPLNPFVEQLRNVAYCIFTGETPDADFNVGLMNLQFLQQLKCLEGELHVC